MGGWGQKMAIFDDLQYWILGISFHAVIVFGLGKNLLFKSVLRQYDWETLYALSSQAAFELEHFKLAAGEKIETPN